MKKILCILLGVCMLLTQAIALIPVQAASNEVKYEDTTLGGYYKFTFSKNEIYNYAFGAQASYKNNTFMPLHAQDNINSSVGYKQVTDSVTGQKYDTLQIKNGAGIKFTPLTKDGQPYELTPGVEYRVKIQMFNPVSNSWAHAFMCVGESNSSWSNFIDIGNGTYNYTTYPYSTGASLTYQGGMGWHYAIKDSTYGKTTTFASFNGGVCLHKKDSRFGLNCSHSNRTTAAPYIQQERVITLPEDHFVYDEVNKSYSATRTVYENNGSSYVATSAKLKVNNYLSFYLAGGDISTYAKGNYPLYGNVTYDDLFDANGKGKDNGTVWQIESIEIWEKEIGRVNYHIGDEVTSVKGDVGTAVDISTPTTPSGKYFIAWYTDPEFKNLLISAPKFTKGVTYNLYAKLGISPDGVTYNLQTAKQPTLKGYTYMKDGKYTTVTLNESGWAYKQYTADGVVMGKSPNGNAYKWNPSKTTGFDQTSSASDYVAINTNAQIGEQLIGGWSAYSNYILRDKDGNPAIAKPNTKYAIAVTYKKLSDGDQSISIGIGRNKDYISSGADDYGNGTYNRFVASAHKINDVEITGEYVTHTFYVNVKSFSEGDVPVISIHNAATGYIVQRVASVNGIKSYNVNGTTYYPYRIISYPQITIKDVQIIEVESGNSAVSYNYYQKGEGFYTVLKDAKPTTPLETTANVDSYWYDSKDARGSKYTTYPYGDLVLYNADYYMSQDSGLNPDAPIFGSLDTVAPAEISKGGKVVNALKYTSNKSVALEDTQILRLGDLKDGHTYKFTASLKADAMNADLKLIFATADTANALNFRNITASKTIAANTVTSGQWKTVTCYFTADPNGIVADKEAHGFDYRFLKGYNSLYLYFVQEEAGQNAIYFADFKVEDLGEIITTGGASVLTDSAAASAGHQAIRYYFSYNSTKGNNIAFGDEAFTIVERGFIYKNGTLDSGETEVGNFFKTNRFILSSSKSDNFDDCWEHKNGVITFSTHVKNLDINNDIRKVQVKAYLLVEDMSGNQYYIYSNSTNRSADGIKNGDPNERRLIWSEEFNVNSISEINSFTQKYDTMSSSDSNLSLSTSEENYFIDSKTGDLVLRITSDGNKNYTTAKSVTTRDIMSYKYGYLEMRAKVPCGKGLWPSFWMQPDKSPWNKTKYTGEIDIFEGYGGPYTMSANLHKWYTNADGKSVSTTIGKTGNILSGSLKYGKDSAAFAQQYHTFGFEWTPEFMAFYVDDELYCKIDVTEETGEYDPNIPGMDCFHNYYYISLNNWMFTDQDTWISASNRVENLPDIGTVDYRIDYVRLYQNNKEEICVY